MTAPHIIRAYLHTGRGLLTLAGADLAARARRALEPGYPYFTVSGFSGGLSEFSAHYGRGRFFVSAADLAAVPPGCDCIEVRHGAHVLVKFWTPPTVPAREVSQ